VLIGQRLLFATGELGTFIRATLHSMGRQAGGARITIVAGQPAGFGEFGGGAFGFAFERIGGGEPAVKLR